jgi:hypothetical protein
MVTELCQSRLLNLLLASGLEQKPLSRHRHSWTFGHHTIRPLEQLLRDSPLLFSLVVHPKRSGRSQSQGPLGHTQIAA